MGGGGGGVFLAAVFCLCYNRDKSVIFEKAKLICFIHMQLQKHQICSNKHETGLAYNVSLAAT